MKKFLLGLGSSSFKIVLLLTAVITSLVLVFGNPATPKNALRDSGIYDSFVDNILETVQKQANQEHSDLPLNELGVKQAIQKSFTPELLQSSGEQIIDGVYRWLNGEVATPDFNVDFNAAKTALATNLAAYATNRFQNLPACSAQQLQQLGGDTDPLNTPCRPPNVTAAQVGQQVTQQISQGEFLSNPVLNAQTLKNDKGTNPFDEAKKVPEAFAWAKRAGWILGVLGLLIAAGLIIFRRDKRAGMPTVGVSLLGTGIFVGLAALITNYLLTQANRPGGRLTKLTEGNTFQNSISGIFNSITSAVNVTMIKFAVAYILIGGALLLVLHITHKQKEMITDEQPVADAKKALETSTDTEKPKAEEESTSAEK